jgi:flagellar protein FliO/FliZ
LLWNFFKLIIVLGLLIGAAWSIIKLFGRQVNTRMQGTWLHLVDEVLLGQNRGLVLCEVAGKIYALGVTDHSINLLFELNDPQLVQEISETNLEELIQRRDPIQDIMDKLKGLFRFKQRSPLPGKNFHILMEEQSRKLHNISQQDISRVINEKRSGLDE